MKTSEAAAHFGSESALARALGIQPQAVYQWGEYPPRLRQLEIQEITDGAIKAEPKQQPDAA